MEKDKAGTDLGRHSAFHKSFGLRRVWERRMLEEEVSQFCF